MEVTLAHQPGAFRSSALARRLTIGQALALVVALGFLTRWRPWPWGDLQPAVEGADVDLMTTTGRLTIYPGWVFVFAAAAVVMTALAAFWTASHRLRSASLVAGATVLAGMVVGTGVVAWRHWRPAFGMQESFNGSLPQLTAFAAGVTIAGAAAVVLGLASLAVRGAFTFEGSPSATAVLCLAGLLVIVAVPAAVAALDSLPGSAAVSVFGAAGLSYGGPWGASIIASAWLRPRAARAALLTVAAAAVVTAMGPHINVLTGDVWAPLVVAALVALLLIPVPRRAVQWQVRPQRVP